MPELWTLGHMRTPIKISAAVFVVLAVVVFALWYMMSASERLLRPVQRGMTQSQVRSLVGSPLSIINRTNGTDAWYYSRWWIGDAVVYFDTNRVVYALETD